ncbi:MAG: IS3 family transposase [Candidatus Kerfeldbacteria bacterium]|nr:IS3 family transposase [Candidatus Kerfeldbacteria bacterium]
MKVLCDLAHVSRSGYYRWLKTADEPDKDHEDYLKIKTIFDESRGRYGWRSIKMYLPEMNHKKIQRLMRKYGLIANVRRRNPYKAIMKKRLEHRIFPNKLQRMFDQSAPYTVFCTDITYIPFQSVFAYLSVVKDIASGEVVAWHLSRGLEEDLVLQTLTQMPQVHEDALIHSDQGFHYTNPQYIAAVEALGIVQSMSGKGSCIDNAPIESFFGHLKDELDYQSCTSFEELRSRIDEYMRYYNCERKQWTHNKMSPIQYREHLLTKSSVGVGFQSVY